MSSVLVAPEPANPQRYGCDLGPRRAWRPFAATRREWEPLWECWGGVALGRERQHSICLAGSARSYPERPSCRRITGFLRTCRRDEFPRRRRVKSCAIYYRGIQCRNGQRSDPVLVVDQRPRRPSMNRRAISGRVAKVARRRIPAERVSSARDML